MGGRRRRADEQRGDPAQEQESGGRQQSGPQAPEAGAGTRGTGSAPGRPVPAETGADLGSAGAVECLGLVGCTGVVERMGFMERVAFVARVGSFECVGSVERVGSVGFVASVRLRPAVRGRWFVKVNAAVAAVNSVYLAHGESLRSARTAQPSPCPGSPE